MTSVRIMTYNVRGCRGGDGLVDPERVARVIEEVAPDIVALQEIDAAGEGNQLDLLARRLGMMKYCTPRTCTNAFLSYYPLQGVQEYTLGQWGGCLRGDADIGGKRLHLLNLRLEGSPLRRSRQIATLLGPDLLESRSLSCPVLILGDFADLWVGAGNVHLTLGLRKARRPFLSSTYPARFPVCGRDRAYLRGGVRVLESSINRSNMARHASTHLPLTLTVKIADPRKFLKVKEVGGTRMEIAPG